MAATTIDPLIGVRIANLGNQEVEAAPPLPGLEESRDSSLTPQAGYIMASINDQQSLGYGVIEDVKGSYTGYSAALGYTSPPKGPFGFFAFGTYDKLSGHIDLTVPGYDVGASLKNMTGSGYSLSAGVSLRTNWSKGSPLSFGLFAGPTISHLSSSFEVDAGTAGTATYSASPTEFGIMGGAQMGLRIGKLFLNPYILRYQSLSSTCVSYNTSDTSDSGSGFTDSCGNDKVDMVVSFTGYGINVGWGNFFVTAYSDVIKDSSISDVDMHVYQLSYSFKL